MGSENQAWRQGEIERFKARYVAKGFGQVNGAHIFETWALLGRYATLHALLSICVVWDLETKPIDIKCACLNFVLHQDVYIVQPPMFDDGTRRVWKLKRALYGLKQAAREWRKVVVELLSELGFDRCHSDPALFVSRVGKCCCKPGPLPIGRSLTPCACRQDILHRSYLMG